MTVTPDKKITIAGADYLLRGTMGVLKDIQNEFDQDVYDIAESGIVRMRWNELAKISALGIGKDAPDMEVIEQHIVQECGLDEFRYELWEWLIAAITPAKDREKKVKQVQELVAAQRKVMEALDKAKSRASRGKTTKSSA